MCHLTLVGFGLGMWRDLHWGVAQESSSSGEEWDQSQQHTGIACRLVFVHALPVSQPVLVWFA